MKQDKKEHILFLRLTKEQLSLLEKRVTENGFDGISEYIRFELFLGKPLVEKINKIYKTVCDVNE